MSIAGSMFQSVLRWSNPHLVPADNQRIDRWVSAHPAEAAARVETAIKAAIGYFEAQPKIDLAALVLLGRLHRTGADPRLRFVERGIAACAASPGDPHFRLLDPTYAPSPDAIVRASKQYDHPVLQLMIKCLYADRNGDGAECLELLSRIDDRGGYGTTHVAVCGLILRAFGASSDAAVASLTQPVADTLIAAQRCDRAGDLFAERIAVLQWLGRHASIDAAWILRLVKAQRPEGGWASGPSLRPTRSSQHTSALALVSLVQWTERQGALNGTRRTPEALSSEVFWRSPMMSPRPERRGGDG